MQPFNPLTIPLKGRQLIEASAGTGKTFSIALLFLRLIVEDRLDVDNILVVTFTNSATEELRGRIRARLREALDVLETAGDAKITHDDKPLANLLNALANRGEGRQRLADALVRMDESAIFTIHGFCRRILQDHAFESGAPFDAEFIESEQLLRREIIRDYWRQRFYPASAGEAKWATATWGDPDGLAGDITNLMMQPGITLTPRIDPESLARARQACEERWATVRACWRECRNEVAEILQTDPCLSRDKSKGYGGERPALALAGMEEIAALDELPWYLPDGADLLAASVMADKLKGKKIAPRHRFFTLFDELYTGITAFIHNARIDVITGACGFLRAELQTRKRAQARLYFDDLPAGLDAALAGPGGKLLAARIRQRFSAALVDEFQDTDPLQYRIFNTLFGRGPEPGLFMIGDPKQSIYSFRGADVFAYIRARKDTPAAAAFTMDTNYRSSPPMVRAVNRLFARQDSFVFSDDIPFSPVKPGIQADKNSLLIDHAPPRPLRAMLLTREQCAAGGQKAIAKESAQAEAAQWTALEIARLLDKAGRGEATIVARPLGGGDLAVLVRTHREAALIRQELARRHINSVYYSQDSVFASEEALELHLLLTALLDLSAASRVHSALATGLFGMNANSLDQLQSEPDKWDQLIAALEEYRLLWQRNGVAAMLQKLLAGQQVVRRLIAQPGGERKLTNYLHLAELLQDASEEHPGPDGLVRWFSLQRAAPAETTEDQQLRLESDEDLVRIVTVHKAKGLEYPVVFLPFAWNGRPLQPGGIFSFHDPESLDHIVDLGSGEQTHFQRAGQERLAEDMRLLYVALTRAKHCCFFCWGMIRDLDKSALFRLLHGHGQDPVLAGLTEEKMTLDLTELNRDEPLLDLVPPSNHPRGLKPFAQAGGEGRLAARVFRGRIDTGWLVASYSKMAQTAEHPDQADELSPETSQPSGETAARNVFSFPRGAAAGTCMHGLFEQIDFAAHTRAELLKTAEEQLRKTGLAPEWAGLACQWTTDVLKTPLDAKTGLQLRMLGKHDKLVEMGFYFAMENLDLRLFNRILADYGFGPVDAGSEILSGLMKGYIDLVFHFQGKYYVADYKSNHLGNSPDGYTGANLAGAMREHRYDLQYLIYSVAMHRYLASRIDGYEYSRHFGGAYYLFLRGMRPDYPPGNGVYFTLPPRELIERLDECFGSAEKQ